MAEFYRNNRCRRHYLKFCGICSAANVKAYLANEEAEHTKDEDCCVDPETGSCRVCGVVHGEPCGSCGGEAFHRSGCPAQPVQLSGFGG